MKILWHSAPAFVPSGYGVQTKEFCKRLMKAGHEVVVVSTAMDLPNVTWEGIRHVTGGGSNYGIEGVYYWCKRLDIDLVITLFDIWTLPLDFGEKLRAMDIAWMPMAMVDHNPVFERLVVRMDAPYPVAVSPFGQRAFKHKGIKANYVPLGVDTKVFKPFEVDRKAYADDDTFIVGCVANNVDIHDRKGLRDTIRTFAKFNKKHPKSKLWYHGVPFQEDGAAIDMVRLALDVGLSEKTWMHTDVWSVINGLTPQEMAEMYNAFDVFLLMTGGEGFGVPLIEAQACNVPVIVTDFTAPQDLVGDGHLVPIKDKRWTLMSSYWGVPDIDKGVEALEKVYQDWRKGKNKSGKAREFALQFDFETVFIKHMMPLLQRIEKNGV